MTYYCSVSFNYGGLIVQMLLHFFHIHVESLSMFVFTLNEMLFNIIFIVAFV